MAWPKLRNKSSGSVMTASNHSGATHDGAQTHEGAPERAPGDSVYEPAEPMPDTPVAWPESAESAEAEVAGAEVAAAEPESADLPMWDWSSSDSSGEPGALDDPADEPAARRANLSRPEWKPVVTPVEEAEGTSRPPGIGEHKGNLA